VRIGGTGGRWWSTRWYIHRYHYHGVVYGTTAWIDSGRGVMLRRGGDLEQRPQQRLFPFDPTDPLRLRPEPASCSACSAPPGGPFFFQKAGFSLASFKAPKYVDSMLLLHAFKATPLPNPQPQAKHRSCSLHIVHHHGAGHAIVWPKIYKTAAGNEICHQGSR